MNIKDLLSMINIIFRQNNLKKIKPLLDENYIEKDILENEIIEIKEDFIDLELGNGKHLITEEKMLYFYNKV